jgi:hypothetical protein
MLFCTILALLRIPKQQHTTHTNVESSGMNMLTAAWVVAFQRIGYESPKQCHTSHLLVPLLQRRQHLLQHRTAL